MKYTKEQIDEKLAFWKGMLKETYNIDYDTMNESVWNKQLTANDGAKRLSKVIQSIDDIKKNASQIKLLAQVDKTIFKITKIHFSKKILAGTSMILDLDISAPGKTDGTLTLQDMIKTFNDAEIKKLTSDIGSILCASTINPDEEPDDAPVSFSDDPASDDNGTKIYVADNTKLINVAIKGKWLGFVFSAKDAAMKKQKGVSDDETIKKLFS